MSREFVYRKVVSGGEVLLPELEAQVESLFPSHKYLIDKTLSNFGLGHCKVIIMPIKPGSGYIFKGIEIRIILGAAEKALMMETLYHEIFHILCPNLEEKEVEEMGVTWCKLMEKRDE